MLSKVCLAKLLSHLPKTVEFYLYIQAPNVISKNVSWLHFSWPTLYVDGKVIEQVDNFCNLGSLITNDAQCSKEIKSRLSKGQYVSAGLKRIWQSHDIAVTTKVLVWPVAVYGCESWTLRAGDEKRIQAFEMQGLRQILHASWTAKRTNDWVLEKAEVSRNLLESVKARKLSYFGHAMRNNADSLEKQIMQGTTSGCHKRGRPKTAWIDNILQWTGYSLDKILLDTEDRGRRRQHVHGAAKPRNEDG